MTVITLDGTASPPATTPTSSTASSWTAARRSFASTTTVTAPTATASTAPSTTHPLDHAVHHHLDGQRTANPQSFYQAQFSGNLIEMTTGVFNNTSSSAYTEANARNAFDAANNNVLEPAASPVTDIQRAALVRGGKVMQQVTFLNPPGR